MNSPFNSLNWPFPIVNGVKIKVIPVVVPKPVYEDALL